MDRDHGRATIEMSKKVMAAASSQNLKARFLECPDYVLTGQSR
jgi:hypothetical protein